MLFCLLGCGVFCLRVMGDVVFVWWCGYLVGDACWFVCGGCCSVGFTINSVVIVFIVRILFIFICFVCFGVCCIV